MKNTQRIALSGLLIAVGVACSPFYIPVGVAKCFPIQHMINILAGVMLGPLYAVLIAFGTSLIRVLTGMGSLLAFPGSMIGAFLAGLLYQKTQKLVFGFMGEVVGTGIIGAMVAFPVAALLMGKKAAMFAFVIPFTISSFGGAIIGVLLAILFKRANLIKIFTKERK